MWYFLWSDRGMLLNDSATLLNMGKLMLVLQDDGTDQVFDAWTIKDKELQPVFIINTVTKTIQRVDMSRTVDKCDCAVCRDI